MAALTLTRVPRALARGALRFLTPAATPDAPAHDAANAELCLPLAGPPAAWPRVGSLLGPAPHTPLFRVLSLGRLPLAETGHAAPGCWVRVLQDLPEDSAPLELAVWKQGLSLAWVTLSDKGAAGERSDASGPLLEELARAALDIGHAQGFLLPDEEPGLRALLTDLALTQGYDLILTTGGTGVGPRDVTPQATLAVIEKRLPGFEQAMTAASLAKTPHGAISRAVAGTLGPALIVNLPGSRKAVAENLEAVLPAAAHCIAKLQGDPSECGG